MPLLHDAALGAILAVLLASLSACALAQPTGPTVGQLAERGEAVYSTRCAKCHGVKGEGATCPPVIGDNAALAKYRTAGELLTYLSSSMPFDAPGSLSSEEYSQALAYLLLQNHLAAGRTVFTPDSMSSIRLQK